MANEKSNTIIRFTAAATFILMVAVNALANILPINGVTTGQISAMYENLFTPAPYTFLIWGVIYFLLTFYVLYQLGFFGGKKSKENAALLNKVSLLFSVSSIANTVWIFAWHYDIIWLSVILILAILFCLILILKEISKYTLSPRENLFIKLPFSVYFGWITVAVIANITVFLVSIGWEGFGISEEVWMVIVLFIGALIGIFTMININSAAYGLTLIWAYLGILVNHVSPNGYNSKYPQVIFSVIICIAVFAITAGYLIRNKKSHNLK